MSRSSFEYENEPNSASFVDNMWSMRMLYWSQSLIWLGVPTVLKVGNAGELTATPTLATGINWCAIFVIGSMRLAGITLPGNGRPDCGSITSAHLRLVGLA